MAPNLSAAETVPTEPTVPTSMDLLRLAAVGSVDDGKSTLIGRLLHDTKQLFDDQLVAVEEASARRGSHAVDLSFVTDGLRAEREQGITIDVAYRYAATPTRKLVIADCPGHVQYTRNMATGASNADVALVVVDAQRGLRDQTRRHTCIAALLGVRHLVVAANKMDLVDWDPRAYHRVVEDTTSLAERLGVEAVSVVPVSALHGDNVAAPSGKAPWYDGPTVLDALESVPLRTTTATREQPARLPVQWVLRRPGGGRAYAGMVSGGVLAPGDPVVVLPGGRRASITSVTVADRVLTEAPAGLSVAVELDTDLDVSRGDLLAGPVGAPRVVETLEATVCWFAEGPLRAGTPYRVKHTTRVVPARVVAVTGRLDVRSLAVERGSQLEENDIGTVTVALSSPIVVDDYRQNRVTGSFVLIDPTTNATVAAGMIGPLHLGPTGTTRQRG